MKGRCCTAIFFAAITILLASIYGYSNNTANSPNPDTKHKIAAKRKPIKRGTRQTPQLGPAKVYVARQGDCLVKIAHAFGTTPEAIKSANNLPNNKIRIGQRIRIPISEKRAKSLAAKAAEAPSSQMVESIAPQTAEGGKDQSQVSDPGSQPIRLRLVQAGFEMMGVRYRRSGGSEQSGFDCSGLVKSLFARFDIELPRSSREQYKLGEKIDRDKLEAGDLVFFSSGGKLPTHVGIYVGDNKFLHAARRAHQVIVSDLTKFWYAMRYIGARRIANLWGEEPTSPDSQAK